jgi:site-specific recombinase XerD
MKPSKSVIAHNKELLEIFVNYKKSTKGLTVLGEEWLRDMLGWFFRKLSVNAEAVTPEHVTSFLAPYHDRPYHRHGLYRALKSLYRWLKRHRYIQENPIEYIETPKVPDKLLNTITPEQVAQLIGSASCIRDKAIISLFADSGARRSELCNIRLQDLDLEHSRIRVLGKGNKEGYLIFGAKTKGFLLQHISENNPQDKLFDLNYEGVKSMLRRLGDRTGIQVRPHDFRRGFATALRRMGVGELDIQQLGRWSSLEMVRRYTKAFTFDDAVGRYRPIVT